MDSDNKIDLQKILSDAEILLDNFNTHEELNSKLISEYERMCHSLAVILLICKISAHSDSLLNQLDFVLGEIWDSALQSSFSKSFTVH